MWSVRAQKSCDMADSCRCVHDPSPSVWKGGQRPQELNGRLFPDTYSPLRVLARLNPLLIEPIELARERQHVLVGGWKALRQPCEL